MYYKMEIKRWSNKEKKNEKEKTSQSHRYVGNK